MELERIKRAKTKWIGKEINYYPNIGSTQEEAHRLVKEERPKNGTILITDNQTKGIGTKQRIWYCQAKKNITMTLILYPQCQVEKMKNITKDIAQCIKEAIEDLYQIELTIKEPNDLLLNRKKIAGILTQSSSRNGAVNELIIGIGFNVNQVVFPEEIQDIATSLKKEYNKQYSREDIVIRILEKLEPVIEGLKEEQNRKKGPSLM